MLRLLLFASLAVAAFGARFPLPNIPSGGRIVGGEDATIREMPYQAALLSYGYQLCGATIISANVVVSAAHCGNAPVSSYKVRAGTDQDLAETGQTVDVSRIVIHEDYDVSTIDYDISLIFLATPFTLGASVSPILLPTQGQSIPDGTMATISGWGALIENGNKPITLQKASLSIINQEACIRAYSDIRWIVTDRMICAGEPEGGKDACTGDSGGPLVIDGRFIGISSWGYGCGRREYPGVWARVPSLINWIYSKAAFCIIL